MISNKLEPGEEKNTSKVDTLLETLSDGRWHKFDDLEAETNLERDIMLNIVNFFRDYGFIEISMGGEAAKIDKDYLLL